MCTRHRLVDDISRIYAAARGSGHPERCMVAPSPDLNNRLRQEIRGLRTQNALLGGLRLRAGARRRPGFNDGTIVPPDEFPLATPASTIRNFALRRAPLRGTVRVIVVLADFSDRPMTATADHFRDLFFSQGVVPTKSVREYYTDVTNGLVDLQGEVVGPLRLPRTLADYAHAASGVGDPLPNARTMARDAVAAADPTVNFAPYDNDGNGYVDAFIVIHAGPGAEETGGTGDIWSHKWVLDGGAVTADGTRIYGYLTVPEDCRIGVCAHELGHLLFGFPDLYDTDYSSEGVGDWCLMGGGSWGGGGNTPVHPCAWCKANQGWASVENVTANGNRSIADVKDSHTVLRLWKDGASGNEYFLVENRQQAGFDASLPAGGLLIWHVDEAVDGNDTEAHYKVALMQADNRRDLEGGDNRGDAGDPYPGASGNATFSNTSAPNSKSYSNQNTCVSVSDIGPAGAVMSVNLKVRCRVKHRKELSKDKEVAKELRKEKEWRHEKPLLDKGLDKPVYDKLLEGGFGGGFAAAPAAGGGTIEARVAQLEAMVGQLMGGGGAAPGPFIGAELRPDLSQGALADEDDLPPQPAGQGGAGAKRSLDTKARDA